MSEDITGKQFNSTYVEENRSGDHIWYISDLTRFKEHYPDWELQYDVKGILQEIYDNNIVRWKVAS
jgi:CDP-paratose 2-epimerase